MPRAESFRKRLLLVVLTLIGSAAGAEARQQTESSSGAAAPLTLADYREVLSQMQQGVDRVADGSASAASVLKELPPAWVIKDARGNFEVPTDHLRSQLARLLQSRNEKDRSDAVHKMKQSLAALQAEAKAFEEPSPATEEVQRKMNEILRRREFQDVQEPGVMAQFWREVRRRIFQMLEWLFSRIGPSGVGDFLVWLLIAVILALLGILLVRSLRRGAAGVPVVARSAVPLRNWREWLVMAEKAAAAGDFRGAVHATYWAGVVWLEERGAFASDRTRTPRESLRLLPQSDPRRASLRGITERMEVTWYGYRAATQDDLRDARTKLEELGCPVKAAPVTANS